MPENILGPSYSIMITFDPGTDETAVRFALLGAMDATFTELKPPLAGLLFEYFTNFVNSFVGQLGYEHDGYEFNWDQEPTVDIDRDESENCTATIYFGINVQCKDEDFDFFDDILQREQFADLYGQAITGIFVHHLEEAGFKVPEKNVRFDESEFGYG